jgi:hypothetical protein
MIAAARLGEPEAQPSNATHGRGGRKQAVSPTSGA